MDEEEFQKTVCIIRNPFCGLWLYRFPCCPPSPSQYRSRTDAEKAALKAAGLWEEVGK